MPRCAEFMARCWWRGAVQDCTNLFQVLYHDHHLGHYHDLQGVVKDCTNLFQVSSELSALIYIQL